MRCEVVSVGTELLLGQIVDTNAAWLGRALAAAGVACHARTTVGDNHARIVDALRVALGRSEAVIVCGGLGPTADDITREALAAVAGVPLRRDARLAGRIAERFAARGRGMPASNLRQADVPVGATPIDQVRGTAPGLVMPVGRAVVYALPGVPHEMEEMASRAVLPDLVARAAAAGSGAATIVSRLVRTWGLSEAALAERVAPRLAALDGEAAGTVAAAGGRVTLAFLAQGIDGVCVRVTARAPDATAAAARLDHEEAMLRALLGDTVFGVDDQTMESVVAEAVVRGGWSLGLAESLTGGLVASRLAEVPGASAWFRGSVVAYDSRVKYDLLGVPVGPVVCAEAAAAMAEGAARALGASCAVSLTGVAGPATQEGVAVGTVFVGCLVGPDTEVVELHLGGDRRQVREHAAVSALDVLRHRLGAAVPEGGGG